MKTRENWTEENKKERGERKKERKERETEIEIEIERETEEEGGDRGRRGRQRKNVRKGRERDREREREREEERKTGERGGSGFFFRQRSSISAESKSEPVANLSSTKSLKTKMRNRPRCRKLSRIPGNRSEVVLIEIN